MNWCRLERLMIIWGVAALLLTVRGSSLFAGYYTYTYDFPSPQVEMLENGLQAVQMPGTSLDMTVPGAPVLPAKDARMFIPANERVIIVTVDAGLPELLPGSYTIRHALRPRSISSGISLTLDDPDPAIYSADADYPEVPYSNGGMHRLCGAKIAILTLKPVTYNPVRGRITYYPRMTVTIETAITKGNEAMSQAMPARHSSPDRRRVLDFIDNDELFLAVDALALTDVDDGTEELWEYVIITTEEMSPAFEILKNHRETEAGGSLTTHLETIESLTSSLEYADSRWPDDRAVMVRNFIRECYQHHGTRYVVLGGDCDSSSASHLIPGRGVQWDDGSTVDEYVATDLYFACLDGSWNSNRNEVWGEMDDGGDFNSAPEYPYANDIDLLAEVYVGRIVADNSLEAENHITKIIAYERNPDPFKTLLVGEQLDDDTWGGDVMDYVFETAQNHIPVVKLYDYYEDPQTGEGVYDPWSTQDILDQINSDQYNWINHMGHSLSQSSMNLHNFNVPEMTNSNYFLIYTEGCHSGNMAANDCFAEAITNEHSDRGAFAFIGNSCVAYYPTIQHQHRYFVDELFRGNGREPVTIGEALQKAKESITYRTDTYRLSKFEANLFGDPATIFITDKVYLWKSPEEIGKLSHRIRDTWTDPQAPQSPELINVALACVDSSDLLSESLWFFDESWWYARYTRTLPAAWESGMLADTWSDPLAPPDPAALTDAYQWDNYFMFLDTDEWYAYQYTPDHAVHWVSPAEWQRNDRLLSSCWQPDHSQLNPDAPAASNFASITAAFSYDNDGNGSYDHLWVLDRTNWYAYIPGDGWQSPAQAGFKDRSIRNLFMSDHDAHAPPNPADITAAYVYRNYLTVLDKENWYIIDLGDLF